MAVLIDESVLADLFQELASYRKVTSYFGLNDAQARSKNCGEWLIDCIKQYQTSYQLSKTLGMLKYENKQVEHFGKEERLPEKNPLIGETDPETK